MLLDEFIKQTSEIAKLKDWEKLPELQIKINQAFIDNDDTDGLEDYYQRAISLCFDKHWREKIIIKNISKFETEISRLNSKVKCKIEENNEVKAVYLEYFYDGGDCCEGNIFLCNSYTEDDDYWASELTDDGFIQGPKVNEYLDFDPDFELDGEQEIIANFYTDAMLLSASVRAWKNSGIQGYPFGFAQHDNPIIRVRNA